MPTRAAPALPALPAVHAPLLALLLGGCVLSEAPSARVAGLLLDARLHEVSGIAASRRHPGQLWAHNDGGDGARLYALGARGGLEGELELEGVANTDWEDLAAFELDGRRYLLVADVGDNGGLRHTLQLHVVEEPEAISGSMRRAPAWSITFRWPDGPRDCEAVAVDAESGRILLVSKKQRPPELYALPLQPRDAEVQVAERLGALSAVPAPGDGGGGSLPAAHAGLRGQVTAADIAPDGRRLAVLTYDEILVYERRAGEAWAQAVARPPARQALPLLPQAEALGWQLDGARLYATGEFRPAPLFLIDPDP